MKVLVPESLAALQQQVQQLHAEATPWLPAGLASRLDWGPPVRATSLVLSCRGLGGIRQHRPGDFTLTVAAGTTLEEVQAALAPHRQWLAVDHPWGQAPSSIGGLLARGLSGGYRQRAMGVRDQLLGLQLLRSDGVLARAGGQVVKNVAGYDLMRLLCGSWGSLGLITEVTLRVQPIPPERRSLLIQGELNALAALARWLLGSSLSPERSDLGSAPVAAAAGLDGQPWLLISLASIDAATLGEQMACIEGKASPLPVQELDPDGAQALLAAQRGLGIAGDDWLLRLGVPPSQASSLLAAPELQGLPVVLAAGSGSGDAWGSASALPRHRVDTLRQRCTALGGHLSVLRQPAPANGSDPLPAWLDAPSRPLIEAVKREFDPLQQLARGRLPGVAG